LGAYEKLGVKIGCGKEYLCEALGVSEKRMEEICDYVEEAFKKSETLSSVLKNILEKFDGAEAVLAIFSLGVKIGTRRTLEKMAASFVLGSAVLRGLTEAREREEEAREA